MIRECLAGRSDGRRSGGRIELEDSMEEDRSEVAMDDPDEDSRWKCLY